jgi:glycosyltransferase involved in cell wall biosynthesis
MAGADTNRPEIAVIIPVFNEADNIEGLVRRLVPVLERVARSFEVVFVDDGSSDDTMGALRRANEQDPRLTAVSFSRNFGKEIAIAAGLDHTEADAVVIMDADVQHPPEVIETFVAKWREGYKNVYGQRTDRSTDGRTYSGFARRFYRMFERFAETPLPEGESTLCAHCWRQNLVRM